MRGIRLGLHKGWPPSAPSPVYGRYATRMRGGANIPLKCLHLWNTCATSFQRLRWACQCNKTHVPPRCCRRIPAGTESLPTEPRVKGACSVPHAHRGRKSREAPAGRDPQAWLAVTDGRGLAEVRGWEAGPAGWRWGSRNKPFPSPGLCTHSALRLTDFPTIRPLFCDGDLFLAFLQPGQRFSSLPKPDLHFLPHLLLARPTLVAEGAPSWRLIYSRNNLKGSVLRPPFIFRRANSRAWATWPSVRDGRIPSWVTRWRLASRHHFPHASSSF